MIVFDSNTISVMVLNCSCGHEVMLLVELNNAMIVIVRICCPAGETVCLLQDMGTGIMKLLFNSAKLTSLVGCWRLHFLIR